MRGCNHQNGQPWFHYESDGDGTCFSLHIPSLDLGPGMITCDVPVTEETTVWMEYTVQVLGVIIEEQLRSRRRKV